MIPIIKHFSASGGFPAVYYNMHKVASLDAKIISAKNLGILHAFDELKSSDIENYFLALSSLTQRSTNDQFHAMISSWKQTMSEGELKELGERWIEDIGYIGQPYFIFFHTDSQHNHIHLLSCKTRLDGSRVDTAFIKIRGMRALHRILNVDREADFKREVSPLLSYSFSSISQLSLLLKSKGYSSGVKNGIFKIWKYGESLLKIDEKRFSELTIKPSINIGKVLSVRSQINKHFDMYDRQCYPIFTPSPHNFKTQISAYQSDLSVALKEHTGIEIFFHFSREMINGYTVIDHSSRSVFEGEQIMDLDRLISPVNTLGHLSVRAR